MKEVFISDKQQYFDDNYPFLDPPVLMDKRLCIHCDREFYVGDYKVFKNDSDFEFICWPYAPECNGTLIDWFPVENKSKRKGH